MKNSKKKLFFPTNEDEEEVIKRKFSYEKKQKPLKLAINVSLFSLLFSLSINNILIIKDDKKSVLS
jgi:hypothetical protein